MMLSFWCGLLFYHTTGNARARFQDKANTIVPTPFFILLSSGDLDNIIK